MTQQTLQKNNLSEIDLLASLLRIDHADYSNSLDAIGEIIEKLDYHGITALVHENLIHQEAKLTKALSDTLNQRMPLMVANEALRQNELSTLFSAFEQADLSQYLVFKGTALAYNTYPKPWLRPRTDTDILILKSQLDEFTDVFTALGYQREFAITGDLISYQCTFGKRLVGNASINLDVHWRINNRQCLASTFDLEELLSRGQLEPKLGKAVMIPSKLDSLIIACLHRLGHHHTEERLAWLYDIHLLAGSLTKADWQTFSLCVPNKGLANLCLDGLRQSQLYFHTDIPSNVLEELDQIKKSSEPSAIFLQKDLPNWQILKSDVNAINSWVDKVRFLYQTCVPSPSYIRQRMGTRSALLGYIKRAFSGLKRLLG